MLRSDSHGNRQCHLPIKQREQLKTLLKGSLHQMAGVQRRKIFIGTVFGTFIHSLLLLPAAWADTARLGVVRSPENEAYWSGITSRLVSAGVDYCVVDFAQVQQASDLGSPQLLFLPNIEQLKSSQLAALQEWMSQGGRVIVSGPVGTLSQPEIRNRLRSLLGAYWGFALTKPSELEPLRTNTQTWVRQSGLASNIQGGVVIPAGLNSVTAAVWSQSDNPPAVVTTDKSTFFGWRWGIDGVASREVDSAWLRAALGRYGLTGAPGAKAPAQSQQYCAPSKAPTAASAITPPANAPEQNTLTPPTSSPPNQIAQTDPDDVVTPTPSLPRRSGAITATEATALSQELENLIGRFESALLAANATNSNVDLQTGAAIEQFLVASAKDTSGTNAAQTASQVLTSPASRAVAEARAALQNFRDAIASKDYNRARQQWLEARRLLWDNYPTDRRLAQSEIRAIWLDRGTIVTAKSEQDLARIFDKLAVAGFNTVFFETVNASYPIYPSRVAPEQNPLVRGWDPLKAAVKLAHERGMELHAWVWMFAAANQRHNALMNQPINYTGPVLAAHPDWAMFDKRGRLFDQNTKKAFLDPANPEVRNYLMALLEEIATQYEVDGIQLDYIRYPFQDPSANQIFGYSPTARQQFKELTGVDPINVAPRDRELWQKWTDFRIRQIDSFVATVSQRLHTQRPNLILSAAVFPLPRSQRLQRLQQNWEDWAIRGYIDLMVPMTYSLDTKGLQNLAQPLLVQPSLGSSLILPGIRLLNLPNIGAVDQIQLLRDLPAGGYALFAVENLDTNLLNILGRTQGVQENINSRSQSPIPYRQPFSAAAARYATLQREWSFLLANQQILIQEPASAEWGKQADALSVSLNQLAAEPSKKNLLLAQSSLRSFRAQFQKWMQQQASQQPYQVQVWDNRLATIERLLRYGERTALD